MAEVGKRAEPAAGGSVESAKLYIAHLRMVSFAIATTTAAMIVFVVSQITATPLEDAEADLRTAITGLDTLEGSLRKYRDSAGSRLLKMDPVSLVRFRVTPGPGRQPYYLELRFQREIWFQRNNGEIRSTAIRPTWNPDAFVDQLPLRVPVPLDEPGAKLEQAQASAWLKAPEDASDAIPFLLFPKRITYLPPSAFTPEQIIVEELPRDSRVDPDTRPVFDKWITAYVRLGGLTATPYVGAEDPADVRLTATATATLSGSEPPEVRENEGVLGLLHRLHLNFEIIAESTRYALQAWELHRTYDLVRSRITRAKRALVSTGHWDRTLPVERLLQTTTRARKAEDGEARVEIFGLSFPVGSVVLLGSLLLATMLAYQWAHLVSLTDRVESARVRPSPGTPWIGTSPRLAHRILLATSTALPAAASIWGLSLETIREPSVARILGGAAVSIAMVTLAFGGIRAQSRLLSVMIQAE